MNRSQPVTITDVARAADCSVATVSRALRGYENVAPATAERVRRVAAELGYRANRHASQLRAQSANTLYVLVPSLDDPHYSEVVAGMEAVTSESDFDLIVSIGQNPIAVANTLRRIGSMPWVAGAALVDIDVAGLEGLGGKGEGGELDDAVARSWVSVGAEHPQCSSLIVDDAAAGRMATEYLLSLGHRQLGFVGGVARGAPFVEVDANRRAGFLAAISDTASSEGVEFRGSQAVEFRGSEAVEFRGSQAVQFTVERTIDGGVAALNSILTVRDRPTAVVCSTSEIAFGLQRAALAVGLEVPGDLSIVGVGDWDLGLVSGLTMVRLPTATLGAQAAALLINRGSDDEWPVLRRFEAELVIRDSACPADPSPTIR